MASGTPLSTLRLGFALVGMLTASLAVSISPAYADLRICNETANPISLALGYRAERGWQSEGWWIASPKQCATVFQGDLSSRFYYLFAADDIGGGAWDGTVYMCTRDETFTIFGVEDCLARGYERTGFFEIDTQNRTDWTLQLTDGEQVGAPEGGDVEPLDSVDAPGDGEVPELEEEPMGAE